MPGTFFGFNTALRGMQAQQRGIYTTAHNIANANTEGYTRQRVVLATTPAYPVPAMNRPGGQGWQIGTGVDSQETRRMRDEFLDTQIRRETGSLGMWEQIQDVLQQVEIVFNEPSDTGLSTLMSQFWAAWQELSKYAESSPVRTTVVETASALAEAFNHSAAQLETIKNDIDQTIELKVKEINSLAQQIADLNGQIKNLVTVGDQPNDLMDQRDLLLDRLSKIINFTLEKNVGADGKPDGTIKVLVDGTDITEVGSDKKIVNIVSTDSTDKWKVLLNGTEVTFDRGEIKGLQEAHDDVQVYIDNLNTLAGELAAAINTQHQAGYGIETPPQARLFFVPATGTAIDASNISVNSALQDNPMLVAAAATVNAAIASDLGSGAVGKGLDPGAMYQIVASGGELQLQKSTDGGSTWIPVGARVSGITWDGATAVTVGDSDESITFTTSASSPPDANYDVTLVIATSGDGSNALAIAQLQHKMIPNLSNATFDDYYKNFTAKLGVDAHEAGRMTTNQGVLVDQLTNRKETISGVSLDEEMANMLQYQRAYEASARVITTLDAMLDKIINGMGVTR
ncbi:Flagellar hook-associated protein 1 [Moorella humiferrea]|uniref:flagellar hook-associated protein FlgK n=1 Tax=Neomoorella humiferrea TaxID=676965 RepID=UPI0030CB75E3